MPSALAGCVEQDEAKTLNYEVAVQMNTRPTVRKVMADAGYESCKLAPI